MPTNSINYDQSIEQTIEIFSDPAFTTPVPAPRNRVEIVVVENNFFERIHNFIQSVVDRARTFMRLIGMERLGAFLFPVIRPAPQPLLPMTPEGLDYLERSVTPAFHATDGFHTHTAAGRPVVIPYPQQPDLSTLQRTVIETQQQRPEQQQSEEQQQGPVEQQTSEQEQPTHSWTSTQPTALISPQQREQPETTVVAPIVTTLEQETKFEVGARVAGNLILPGLTIAGMFQGTTPYSLAAEIVPETIQEVIGPFASTVGGSAILGAVQGSMVARRGEGIKSMVNGASDFANRAAVSYFIKVAFSTAAENLGPTGLAVGGLLMAAGAIGYAYWRNRAAPQPA